jgi:hypothetical protein
MPKSRGKAGDLRRVAQVRALAQRGVAVDSLDQAFGDRFGIHANEPGELPHAFAMSQTDDDGTSIGRDPYM